MENFKNKNIEFLKANREEIIAEINDNITNAFLFRNKGLTLKMVMEAALQIADSWSNDFEDMGVCNVCDAACVEAKDNKILGPNHNAQDFQRAATRRQAVNL
jgi:hypothetical protein